MCRNVNIPPPISILSARLFSRSDIQRLLGGMFEKVGAQRGIIEDHASPDAPRRRNTCYTPSTSTQRRTWLALRGRLTPTPRTMRFGAALVECNRKTALGVAELPTVSEQTAARRPRQHSRPTRLERTSSIRCHHLFKTFCRPAPFGPWQQRTRLRGDAEPGPVCTPRPY